MVEWRDHMPKIVIRLLPFIALGWIALAWTLAVIAVGADFHPPGGCACILFSFSPLPHSGMGP